MLALWLVLGLGYSAAQTPSGRLLRRSAHAEDRPAVFAYGGGMLSVTSKPAEGQGLWSLSVPDWPGSEDAAFAEIWAVEGRISAWAGTCSVAEPAE